MSAEPQGWQAIHAEVLRRIGERRWLPGELIPGEIELAQEFGCARSTVNRALRELAAAGVLERRRKAGTRIALNPVRKAQFDIPVTRLEVERRGAVYRHAVLEKKRVAPPAMIASQMSLQTKQQVLHLRALHLADERPFAYEDRWINPASVPEILQVDFSKVSANEWLVRNAPFSDGDIAFSAAAATARDAGILDCEEGTALFVVDRTTWSGIQSITAVKLLYAPGYRMRTRL